MQVVFLILHVHLRPCLETIYKFNLRIPEDQKTKYQCSYMFKSKHIFKALAAEHKIKIFKYKNQT